MADEIVIKEHDPFENYRSGEPLDINNPAARAEIAGSILGKYDRGGEVGSKNISAEQLAEINERSLQERRDHNSPVASDVVREMLNQRGISSPSPRGRRYFT